MNSVPNRVWFSLTGSCNNLCSWCYRKGSEIKRFLDTDFIISASRTLSESGVKHCTLAGGEPTIHPDLLTIVDKLAGIFKSCGLITNGRLLSKFVPDEWSGGKKVQITVSMHGADEKHYFANTRSKTGFRESVNAIRNLNAMGIHCSMSVVLGKENLARYVDFVKLAASLKVRTLCFTIAIPSIDDSAYIPSPIEVSRAVEDINSLCLSLGQKHTFVFNLPWCILKKDLLEKLIESGSLLFNCPVPGGLVLVIKENGSLCLCTHTTGFELLDEKATRKTLSEPALFLDFWNSEKMQILRQAVNVYRHPNCLKCKYRNYCKGGCPLWWNFYDFSETIAGKEVI